MPVRITDWSKYVASLMAEHHPIAQQIINDFQATKIKYPYQSKHYLKWRQTFLKTLAQQIDQQLHAWSTPLSITQQHQWAEWIDYHNRASHFYTLMTDWQRILDNCRINTLAISIDNYLQFCQRQNTNPQLNFNQPNQFEIECVYATMYKIEQAYLNSLQTP